MCNVEVFLHISMGANLTMTIDMRPSEHDDRGSGCTRGHMPWQPGGPRGGLAPQLLIHDSVIVLVQNRGKIRGKNRSLIQCHVIAPWLAGR